MDDYSIVEIFDGPIEAHRCGYCKSKGSLSYGMWTHNLTVRDYQALIDRGWRRSGKYCYKPFMQQTCCPLYSIKCNSVELKLSKSHKKILHRMHRFLRFGDSKLENENHMETKDQNTSADHSHQKFLDMLNVQTRASIAEENIDDKRIEKQLSSNTYKPQISSPLLDSVSPLSSTPTSHGRTNCTADGSPAIMTKRPTLGKGPDPKKPQCRKAKLIRMEKKLEKLTKRSKEMVTPMPVSSTKDCQKNIVKTLQDYLSETLPPDAAHKLEIKLVRSEPPSAEYRQTFEESYEVYKMYQTTIHNDPPERCSSSQFSRFLVNSPLEVKSVRCWPRSLEFKSTMEESYSVYALYQRSIHQETDEDFDKNTYFDFLVNSPLEPVETTIPSHPGYGSFHQQYWLDEKLIAVGVIDILPFCVSSVYFYYDPKYSFLSLGTYGALREIAFTQQLNKLVPELQYYYMGYYIHSCQKMRYKGQYNPSMLLCPEAYTWQPIEQAIQKLNETKYCRLEERDMDDEEGKVDLNDVMVLHRRTALPYYIYLSLKHSEDPRESEEILTYAKLVGKRCAGNLLLYRK